MTRRTDRINGLLRQEISQLLYQDLKDPRLSGVVTITRVETSSDLGYARVFVSVLGNPEEETTALDGINSAAGFLRRELRVRLALRHIPVLKFILDRSMKQAEHIVNVMDHLSLGERYNPGSQDVPAENRP